MHWFQSHTNHNNNIGTYLYSWSWPTNEYHTLTRPTMRLARLNLLNLYKSFPNKQTSTGDCHKDFAFYVHNCLLENLNVAILIWFTFKHCYLNPCRFQNTVLLKKIHLLLFILTLINTTINSPTCFRGHWFYAVHSHV